MSLQAVELSLTPPSNPKHFQHRLLGFPHGWYWSMACSYRQWTVQVLGWTRISIRFGRTGPESRLWESVWVSKRDSNSYMCNVLGRMGLVWYSGVLFCELRWVGISNTAQPNPLKLIQFLSLSRPNCISQWLGVWVRELVCIPKLLLQKALANEQALSLTKSTDSTSTRRKTGAMNIDLACVSFYRPQKVWTTALAHHNNYWAMIPKQLSSFGNPFSNLWFRVHPSVRFQQRYILSLQNCVSCSLWTRHLRSSWDGVTSRAGEEFLRSEGSILRGMTVLPRLGTKRKGMWRSQSCFLGSLQNEWSPDISIFRILRPSLATTHTHTHHSLDIRVFLYRTETLWDNVQIFSAQKYPNIPWKTRPDSKICVDSESATRFVQAIVPGIASYAPEWSGRCGRFNIRILHKTMTRNTRTWVRLSHQAGIMWISYWYFCSFFFIFYPSYMLSAYVLSLKVTRMIVYIKEATCTSFWSKSSSPGETTAMRTDCNALGSNYHPKMSIIVAQPKAIEMNHRARLVLATRQYCWYKFGG